MNPKIATARAYVAYISRRLLRLVSLIFFGIVGLLLILVWALGYFFSAWWWALATPIVLLVLLFVVLRLVLNHIITKIYRHPLTRDQRTQLEAFSAKFNRLVESSSTPLVVFALITIKDLFLRRDASTIRQLAGDTASLKSDIAELESHFGDR